MRTYKDIKGNRYELTGDDFATMLTEKWFQFQGRHQARDERMLIIDTAVRGEWDEVGPGDEDLEVRSPNLIQVALEDTAEAASIIPSVRVQPSDGTDEARNRALQMERIATSYLSSCEIELFTIQAMMNLAEFGFVTGSVVDDPVMKVPRLEHRDPRTCYPEPDLGTLGIVKQSFMARDIYVSQLPEPYKVVFEDWCGEHGHEYRRYIDRTMTLLEFYSEDEIVIAGVMNSSASPFAAAQPGRGGSYITVVFERLENTRRKCPVIYGQRPTPDQQPRGQFDQVIPVMRAHIRLMALVLDYADQAVYSDIWVKDVIGEVNTGGNGYIQLGERGDIGRVPPAVTSLSVFQEMQTLVDHLHIGGRWPKVRPGEVDQAIASAKFVEATAGMMNTVIRTYHLVMKRFLENALRQMFEIDKRHGRKRAAAGVLRNQQFLIEVDPNDIDLEAQVNVEYGLGLGRDPAQSMVLAIQGSQAGLFSREFVQENFEGITDVGLERVRLDTQQLRDMAMAQLLQGLQDKTIPSEALVEIYKARQKGKDIVEIFEKYVAKPAAEQAGMMIPSGLPGMDPMMPGAPPPEEGGGAPAAPPPEELMAMLGGGPPPEANSRLSVPLGGGSFVGSQTGP